MEASDTYNFDSHGTTTGFDYDNLNGNESTQYDIHHSFNFHLSLPQIYKLLA